MPGQAAIAKGAGIKAGGREVAGDALVARQAVPDAGHVGIHLGREQERCRGEGCVSVGRRAMHPTRRILYGVF